MKQCKKFFQMMTIRVVYFAFCTIAILSIRCSSKKLLLSPWKGPTLMHSKQILLAFLIITIKSPHRAHLIRVGKKEEKLIKLIMVVLVVLAEVILMEIIPMAIIITIITITITNHLINLNRITISHKVSHHTSNRKKPWQLILRPLKMMVVAQVE